MLNKLLKKEASIAVIGLGYVGLPLSIAFSDKFNVIGFDVNKEKIDSYRNGIDLTNEVGNEKLKRSNIKFTSDLNDLKEAIFYVIAVPTPITNDKIPDFKYIISASKTVGKVISKENIVVYESTVFPGVTEEICKPILEEQSGLKCGSDFKIGYSPERINPGDKVHTIDKIVKIVSGIDETSLKIISGVYNEIISAGVHEAESIKVAEAAKVIENTQRDVNIAFMNEISMIFNKMNIDTDNVLKAASTKWNFLEFHPGLVGGHCISVDPYYFIYKANDLGYHSQLISVCREINDGMGTFIANTIVKKLIKLDKSIKNTKCLILGFTFKENSNDIRNTKVIDIIKALNEYDMQIDVYDKHASKKEVNKYYDINLIDDFSQNKYDVIILAVAHDEYINYDINVYKGLLKDNPLLIDVKHCLNKEMILKNGIEYWSL